MILFCIIMHKNIICNHAKNLFVIILYNEIRLWIFLWTWTSRYMESLVFTKKEKWKYAVDILRCFFGNLIQKIFWTSLSSILWGLQNECPWQVIIFNLDFFKMLGMVWQFIKEIKNINIICVFASLIVRKVFGLCGNKFHSSMSPINVYLNMQTLSKFALFKWDHKCES